jgi:hypothetical protein
MIITYKPKFLITLAFIAISTILNTQIVLEAPDEYTHIERLIYSNREDAGLYYKFIGSTLDIINIDYESILNIFNQNNAFKVGSNELTCSKCQGNIDYYALRTINISIATIILLFTSLLIKNKKLFFASTIWPSIFYALTGFGSDTFCIPITVAAACLMIERKYSLGLLLGAGATLLDRSGLSLLIFQTTYIFIEKTNININNFSLLIPPLILFLPIDFLLNNFPMQNEIYELVKNTSEFNYNFEINIINRSAALFSSLWYYAGNLSQPALYIEYLIFIATILYACFFSKKTEKQLIFSAAISISTTLLIVPTLAQGRYYFFVIPIIINFIFKKIEKPINLILSLSFFDFFYALLFFIKINTQ